MAVHEITHPLIAHKLGLMRNANVSSKDYLLEVLFSQKLKPILSAHLINC